MNGKLRKQSRLWIAGMSVLVALVAGLIASPSSAAESVNEWVERSSQELTRTMSRPGFSGVVICYLPEYWERLFLLSGATPDPERLRALRSIVLVCVIEGDEATGAFRTSAEVRRSLKLVDAQGRDYLPIAPDSMDAMTETYARILENDFANSMGELGTHLHVYVFKAVDADGKPVIDPQKAGSFAVETDVARYEWQLPWACLAPLRLCPVDGEVMTGPWEYCPRHGVELKAAPVAPAVDPASEKARMLKDPNAI